MAKPYSTTDFYTTAVLKTLKFEIIEITNHLPNGKEDPDGRVKRFHFEDTPELRDVVMKYMNGTLEGNLRDMRNGIEAVKDMVHSG